MIKITFLLLLLMSLTVNANDDVKIISPHKFEVFKLKKLTQIFLVSEKSNKKTMIFNQSMRDEVNLIYSDQKAKVFIIATRPMISGAEKSRFWRVSNGKTVLLGETKCADHQVDTVNYQIIEYRCFSDDPSNPLKLIENKVKFKI